MIPGDILNLCTGKSLSEALTFASINPQYDDRLYIKLQIRYMKIQSSNLRRTCYVQKLFLTFKTILVHNIFYSFSAKRRPSDKDLPVCSLCHSGLNFTNLTRNMCLILHISTTLLTLIQTQKIRAVLDYANV